MDVHTLCVSSNSYLHCSRRLGVRTALVKLNRQQPCIKTAASPTPQLLRMPARPSQNPYCTQLRLVTAAPHGSVQHVACSVHYDHLKPSWQAGYSHQQWRYLLAGPRRLLNQPQALQRNETGEIGESAASLDPWTGLGYARP